MNYDEEELATELGELETNLETMLASVHSRIKSMPLAYLEFGVYWWALKAVMNANGYSYGDESFPLLKNRYSLSSPMLTVYAAYKFAEESRATNFYGNRDYQLDDNDGDSIYTLYDKDMESR